MKLTEAKIQETCSQFLELDGWRRLRMDMKQLRGMGVQEPGMADDLFIRYCDHRKPEGKGCYSTCHDAEVAWIEWKRAKHNPGAGRDSYTSTKAAIHQKAWHAAERARGALTLIAGEDFEASIAGFINWYRQSGLMRRNLEVRAK